MSQQLPCIDCITLAMCKQLIKPNCLTVSPLANKCELFDDYLKKDIREVGMTCLVASRIQERDGIPLDLFGLEDTAEKVKETTTEVLEFFNMNFYVKKIYVDSEVSHALTILFGEKSSK